MPTRREFFERSTTVAAASLVARSAFAAPPPPEQGTPMPPSIRALTSMRNLARPITVAERQARLARARELMGTEKIGALFLTGGTSLKYFTNISWGLSERLLALVLPQNGRAFVVCPAFERDRALEQIGAGPLNGTADVLTWEEHESPYQRIAEGLREQRITTGRLGVEETVRSVFAAGAGAALPAMELVSGTPVTAGCRMVKDAHELALMRLASQVTLKAYEAAYKALHDGMTQDQFADLVALAHNRLGFEGGAGVQVGKFSALPHGSATPQVIRAGSILLIDGGCQAEGYSSDLSRTFVLGKPPAG
jgi:Xaa-Pro dipeptidase